MVSAETPDADDRLHDARPHPGPRPGHRPAARSARTRSSSTIAACTSSPGCPSGARGASRSCSSTASSPARGSGSATSATSPRAAGRATPSTCATTSGRETTDPADARRSRATPRTSWRRSTGSGPTTVVVGHGMGGLLALKAAERLPVSASFSSHPSCRRDSATPAPAARAARRPRRLRPVAHRLVDAAREAPARPSRPDARRRAADPAPPRPEAARGGRARRQCSPGVPVDRAALPDVPRLVIGGRAGPRRRRSRRRSGWPSGWARSTSRSGRTPTTGWSLGEQSYQQVADAIRGVPGGAPPVVSADGTPRCPGVRRPAGIIPTGRAASSGPPAPHSSRGPGHRPLKAEITGSNPVCGTNFGPP